MKKLFLASLVLLMAFTAQAQTKIAPKLSDGFKAVYTEEATVAVGGEEMKVTSDTEYAVSDVSATGAIVTVTTTALQTTADDDDLGQQMMLIALKIQQGVSVKLAVDANGQPLKVQNYADVKAAMQKNLQTLVDKLLADNAQLAQAMPKEQLMEHLGKAIDETTILNGFKESGVMLLNGKAIANGASERFEKEGMKMKRMYFLAGKTVIASSTLDMNKDELKAAIIKQVAEEAPEQAEMIRQNIDMVMGQMTFDITQKATYTMGDNGWPQSIKEETTQDIMGQSLKQTSVMTLKK